MAASDADLASSIATDAGRLLLDLAATGSFSGKELGKEGDHRSNELILRLLAAERPGDAVLSEESVDDPVRLKSSRVWIVDPLDGTREYGLGGRTDWAVHVALWEAGELVAGAVAQPALAQTYSTHPACPLPKSADPVVLVSESRPPTFAAAVASALGAVLQPMGSAGAKAMAVLRGEALAYVHAGGQWEWDSAAPVAVARASGLHTSRVDGTPLVYNEAHPYLPDLVISQPWVAATILEVIAAG